MSTRESAGRLDGKGESDRRVYHPARDDWDQDELDAQIGHLLQNQNNIPYDVRI